MVDSEGDSLLLPRSASKVGFSCYWVPVKEFVFLYMILMDLCFLHSGWL
jgi:hypothetical protein